MRAATGNYSPNSDSWSILAHHDWGGAKELPRTLTETLQSLDHIEEVRLHEAVDIALLTETISPTEPNHGIKRFTFDYAGYEICVSRDGTIAAREY